MEDNRLIKVTDKGYYLDKNLVSNLDWEKKRVNQNWDSCLLITGIEGSGKSTLGCGIGYYMGYDKSRATSNFSLDWVVWTMEQFEEAAKKAKPNQVILWDEFVLAGLSTDALTSMQKKLVKVFTTYRFKRLKFILIIPHIWMLGWYFATSRTSCLIHCYSPDGLRRGFFKFYNKPQKSKLFFTGSKFKTYSQVYPSIDSIYGIKSISEVGISEDYYNQRKLDAVTDLMEDSQKIDKRSFAVYKLIEYIKKLDPETQLKTLVNDAKIGLEYGTLRNLLSKAKQYENEINWKIEQAEGKLRRDEFKMPNTKEINKIGEL